MLFFRRNRGKKKTPKSPKDYSKPSVLKAMSNIVDWQYGQKGNEIRDQYDDELKLIRSTKGNRISQR